MPIGIVSLNRPLTIILEFFPNYHSYFFISNKIRILSKFNRGGFGILKKLLFIMWMLSFVFDAKSQLINCTFDKPLITIHFGIGNSRDVNTASLLNYERVAGYCPTDGHYTYTDYTSDCFRGD
jgi:hypothetical protein